MGKLEEHVKKCNNTPQCVQNDAGKWDFCEEARRIAEEEAGSSAEYLLDLDNSK